LKSNDSSHSSFPIKSTSRFWLRRAMNSSSARVTAAFLVFFPAHLDRAINEIRIQRKIGRHV
jgi:hypothetical protein